MENRVHEPVMLREVIKLLEPTQGKLLVDATVGAAGHTTELARGGARVIGIDRDEEILKVAREKIERFDLGHKVTLKYGNFSDLGNLVDEKVDGILFDLGVSSLQLDTKERGFSFQKDAELDMRMDKTLQVTAQDLVNGLGRKELHELLEKYAEEKYARKLAEAIVTARRSAPIKTTKQLASVIESVKKREGKIHPATKVFQALRIAVNDELNELKAALPSALSLLKAQGVCAVISFHSLEDRIVKHEFKEHEESEKFEVLTPKPLEAGGDEVKRNPRSRSAKLRAIKRNK